MSDHLQVWVRNDKGQVYGPLTPPSVELLIDNGVIAGRMQVSTDGLHYVYPGRVPGLRMIFPKDTWGETITPGDELDAQWSQVVLPPAAAGSGGVPGGPVGAGAPIAGPGIPSAGPGVRAGPGARPASGRLPPAGGPPRAPVMSSPSGVHSMPSGVHSMPSGIQSTPSGVQSTPSGVSSKPLPSVADFFHAAAGTQPAPVRPAVIPPSAAPAEPRSSSGSGLRQAPAAPPPAADPGSLTMPPSGTISEMSPAKLYGIAAATEVTGLLTLKLSDRELEVHFRKGNPEFLASTHAEDSLDVFLINKKLATPALIQTAQQQAGRFGGELLGALFGLGLLNPNAVFQHLGERAGTLLSRVLAAEDGTFTFDVEELPAAKAMPLGNRWAVYLEAMRRIPIIAVKRRLMRVLDNPVMKGSGSVQVSELRLTPQETRALNYFDGVRSLNQLASEFAGESEHILRTAWMLMPLELVRFADVTLSTPRSAVRPPGAPAPARPVPPAAAPPPGAVPGPPPAVAQASRPNTVPGPPPAAGVPGPPVAVAQAPAQRPSTVPGPPPAVAQKPAGPGYPGGARPPAAPYPGSAPSAVAPAAAPAAAPARPPPPVMKPAAPTITAAPPSPANTAAEIKVLQDQYAAMKTMSFFEVLGIKSDADANAVKIAYLKAARSYHPDTVPPGAPEALMKVKADIFALIGEANRTLSDTALRANYLSELESGSVGEKVDVEKLLRAEDQFQKGRILVQNRKFADAVKMLEDAIANNADEAEFYAWRGYAKYMGATDRKGGVQAEALRDLNVCVSKNPNVSSAYFFLGVIQKANGDEKNALTNFKKCVALDPRHIDAAREVRMMTQKK